MEAEAETASAFAVSQEDIDAVLTRGSGVSEGKFRIYEQYLKQESAADNAKMLKEEYGMEEAMLFQSLLSWRSVLKNLPIEPGRC